MAEVAALVELAKTGDLETLQRLLGVQPELARQRLENGESPLMAALYRGHRDVVASLIRSIGDLDVFAASATGRTRDLEHALTAETVNSYAYDGWTPLHLAAFFGQAQAVKLLLDSGADIHAVSRNGLKNTPLHAATAGRHADVALMLLAHGADPTALDAGGYTALRIAQENQLAEVVAAISPDSH